MAERTASGATRRAPGAQVELSAEAKSALVNLSRKFAYDLMDGAGESNADLFAVGGVFLGPGPAQAGYGVEEYLRINRTIREEDVRIVLMRQAFVALPMTADCCCVLSTLHLFLSEGAQAKAPRITTARLCFQWSLADGDPELLSLEVSFLAGGQDAQEPASRSDDLDLWQGSEELLEEPLLEFRDDKRISHFVGAESIRYVEARGRKSIIHCLDESFEVNEGISAIERRLGGEFVRLHRSYLVNAWHLRTLADSGATLDDGAVLQVPSRRLTELRARVAEVRRPRRFSTAELRELVQRSISEG